MSEPHDVLGLDLDDLDWQDLALCVGMPINTFYDDYEGDSEFAKTVDGACLSCPVLAQCLQAGIDHGEYGVWGGIYLTAGKPDESRNSHKTKEVWDRIKERISE